VIIDSNVLTALSHATDRTEPGPRDTQIEVPPLLLSAIEPIQPVDVLSATNIALRSSFVTEAQINKVNPNPAGSQDLCILAKGLWSMSIDVSSFTIGTGGTIRNGLWGVYLVYQGFTIPLLRMLHVGVAGIHSNKAGSYRWLLREDAKIELDWLAPAAGEFVCVNLSLQATRHL